MNGQIARLAAATLILLGSLIVGTTYWQTWASARLADRQDNAIERVAQFAIRRGFVYSADGRLLAENQRVATGGQVYYFRRYPSGPLAAAVVGYSTQSRSRAGLERTENDFLTGSNANLSTVLDRTVANFTGAVVTGNNLVLTLNAKAQQVALDGLAGRCGAAVALDPATGKVLVMASSPTYDPNLVERHFARIARVSAPCEVAAPLLNRATEGLYTPGSTFKVITTAAALDTGKLRPGSTFVDKGYCYEYGKKVSNFADQGRVEIFGKVDLTQALQHSINAVFCQIGKQLGPLLLLDYSRRFGFYSVPPLETPAGERAASGLYQSHRLYRPKLDSDVDPGRLAFGQERMLVTPLQMAMVAAAIGHGGVVMRPYVVDRVVRPGGEVEHRTRPRELGRAIKPETAGTLTQMMVAVVAGGTGRAAQLPGIPVAGKTGTAENGIGRRNTAWFIAFAPADSPKVAVAVVLENQASTGGVVAAPIARQIMQALLGGSPNP